MAVQYLVTWLPLCHVTRVSNNMTIQYLVTLLYQPYYAGTSDRTNIGPDQLLKCLAYIPFHATLTVPLHVLDDGMDRYNCVGDGWVLYLFHM